MDHQIPPDIKAFLENMLYMADEINYGEEVPEPLLLDLYKKLDEWISTYLVSHLPEEKLGEYRGYNQKGSSQEFLDVYLSKNVPDYKEVMKSAYKDFNDSYLEQVIGNRLA